MNCLIKWPGAARFIGAPYKLPPWVSLVIECGRRAAMFWQRRGSQYKIHNCVVASGKLSPDRLAESTQPLQLVGQRLLNRAEQLMRREVHGQRRH